MKFIGEEEKGDAIRKCLDMLLTERDAGRFSAFLHLFTGMLANDESLISFSRFFATSYSAIAEHWPGFHSLPDCSALQRLNDELEMVVRRSQSIKRLDKCIYSLNFISENQPFRPISEFICNDQKEISNLRQELSTQLSSLASSVDQCDSLDTLRTIKRVLNPLIQSE